VINKSTNLDDLLESRLINWGNAYRDNKSFGHCRSIEYRYNARSDPGEETIVKEVHYVGEVDLLDAEVVNKAWLKVLYQNRMVLAYWYINRLRDIRKTCVILGLRQSQYDSVMSRGKSALNKYLQLNQDADSISLSEVR